MIKTCEMCGRQFNARQKNMRTCGRHECRKALYREYNAVKAAKNAAKNAAKKPPKVLDDIVCPMCGDTFTPNRTNRIICFKNECRLARQREYDKKYGRNAVPKEIRRNKIREYSFDSNMMLACDIHNKIPIEKMAKLYDRDIDDLTAHIEKITSDGTVDKIIRWKKSTNGYI